ncbi:Cleavage stimulating factor 64 [Hibiscus syriacus]|uniref:Cleavage stimulating factor 64 n=1 Tax=Hibiscus syriacus TaxID=106335 RepID=A0A6A2WWZ7_HIBSY|nr:Cleavage stimulating factor 64 [Hibiscus syriacus]
MASPQHRCVFVGNIPYDATEEQLIDICREVGPVVSFRLVIDRETGKPKGYGFCEYKDEETALSARRNLQGYEINGRQLRVDFAENDKGSDRNREQGRGGPGLATNIGGLAVQGESFQLQPIGLHSAISAAALVAEALGGVQAGLQHNQNALPGQPAPATDPLTLHLAKMSRSQLNEIMSELKAQVMLGMVNPQVSTLQPRAQLPQHSSNHVLPPAAAHSVVPKLPSINTSVRPQIPMANSSSLSQQLHPSLPHSRQLATANLNHGGRVVLPKAVMNSAPASSSYHTSFRRILAPSFLLPFHRQTPVLSLVIFLSCIIGCIFFELPTPSRTPGIAEKSNIVRNPSEAVNRPLKKAKLDWGESSSPSLGLNVSNVSGSITSQTFGVDSALDKQVPRTEEVQYAEKQVSQPQLAPDVESVLLQQVLNLTPEQLNSLPPEQRQQVIQLQQALRQDQMQQPS